MNTSVRAFRGTDRLQMAEMLDKWRDICDNSFSSTMERLIRDVITPRVPNIWVLSCGLPTTADRLNLTARDVSLFGKYLRILPRNCKRYNFWYWNISLSDVRVWFYQLSWTLRLSRTLDLNVSNPFHFGAPNTNPERKIVLLWLYWIYPISFACRCISYIVPTVYRPPRQYSLIRNVQWFAISTLPIPWTVFCRGVTSFEVKSELIQR